MNSPTPFVSTAEAAFVAGLNTADINRVVDDKLMPPRLLAQEGGVRRVARLGAAFARIYIDMEDRLAARARRTVLEELTRRVEALDAQDRFTVLRLSTMGDIDWTVSLPNVTVDVAPLIAEAASRAKDVDLADMLVGTDPEMMGGLPCFTGTRVPVETVLASLDEGDSMERLQASYPFLTPAHVEAARVYLSVHPRRGRPRRLAERQPSLKPRVSKVVKPSLQ